jgi:hypothetical protein
LRRTPSARHARRWLSWSVLSAYDTASRRCRGLTIFSERVLQDRLVEHEVGDDLPELGILLA